MAKYTTELSMMLSAYASNLQVTENEHAWEIKDPMRGTTRVYKHSDFNYMRLASPNWVIENYGPDFIRAHIPYICDKITDQADLNKEIIDELLRAFIRHFYSYEIGQENPMHWWVVLDSFFQEWLPIWCQEYEKLMIEMKQWETYESENKGTAKAGQKRKTNSKDDTIGAVAQVPQNDLEFKFNDYKPETTYCFDYASQVDGRKTENNTIGTADSEQNTLSTTSARNYTIAQLINQMEGWSNGAYINLFNRAKAYGLFMLIVS